jgi:MoxR-like ATPase
MCLQPILEGSGVYVKKINKFVKPANGFNVVATANTKGQGSDDGKFIGTNVLNEAFLERFPITFEQKYPTATIEEKILINTLGASTKDDKEFCKKLVTWADVIRKTYFDGGVDEIISTRRLVHIIQAFKIFGKKVKAIEVCTNRFDDDTKNSFMELYTKVDAGASAEQIAEQQRQADMASQTGEADESSDDEDVI